MQTINQGNPAGILDLTLAELLNSDITVEPLGDHVYKIRKDYTPLYYITELEDSFLVEHAADFSQHVLVDKV